MLFNLVLLYVIIFYSQLGSRVPALGAIRIELLVGVLIIIGILLNRSKDKDQTSVPGKLNYAIIFFLISLTLSILTAYWTTYAVESFINILKYASLYMMIVFTVDTETRLKKFIWVYLLMVFLIVGEPFIKVLSGSSGSHLGGATGLWAHYNSLGGFAAANIPFLYFLFTAENSRIKKILILLISISSVGSIIHTGSRTAYLGVLGVVCVLWFLSRRKIVGGIALFAIIIVLWTVMPDTFKDRFLTLRNADNVISGEEELDDSMVTRWQIIKDAYSIFCDRPVTGVGINCFPTARGAKFDRWQHTHNLYLQVLTEIGIVGAIAFTLLIYHIIHNLRLSKDLINPSEKGSKWLYALTNAVIVFLIARLIVGMFGMDLYENYWWLAGGLSVAILRVAREKTASRLRSDEAGSKVPVEMWHV